MNEESYLSKRVKKKSYFWEDGCKEKKVFVGTNEFQSCHEETKHKVVWCQRRDALAFKTYLKWRVLIRVFVYSVLLSSQYGWYAWFLWSYLDRGMRSCGEFDWEATGGSPSALTLALALALHWFFTLVGKQALKWSQVHLGTATIMTGILATQAKSVRD